MFLFEHFNVEYKFHIKNLNNLNRDKTNYKLFSQYYNVKNC